VDVVDRRAALLLARVEQVDQAKAASFSALSGRISTPF